MRLQTFYVAKLMFLARTVQLAAITLALALIGMLAVTTSPADASHGCSVPSSRVVARTREAIVFTKGRGIGDNDAVRTYGCYLRKGNTYRLNEPGEFGLMRIERPLSLAGRFVAYVQADASAAGGDFMEVRVRNLITGRVLYRFPGSESAFDSSSPVFSLVSKRNGSTAWISEDYGTDVADRPKENQVQLPRRAADSELSTEVRM